MYNIVKSVPYLATNTDLVDSIEKYIVSRCRETFTNITLSGLPIEPMIKAPTDIAIWYCLATPTIYADLKEDDARNRLRSLSMVAPYLLEVNRLFGYPLDYEFTKKRLELYHAFALMQNMLKNNIDIISQIRTHYQNSIHYNNNGKIEFIFFDGPKSKAYDIFGSIGVNLNLTPEEIYGLSLLLDKTKVNSSIMIPVDFVGSPLPKPTINYKYPIYDHVLTEAMRIDSSDPARLSDLIEKMPDTSPLICPRTLRPYTYDTIKKKHWEICATELHGPIHKQLSTYNYFIDFITNNDRYPVCKEEFINYMYKGQLCRMENSTNTLPFHTEFFVDCLYKRYTNVMGDNFRNVSVHEFINITNRSRDKNDREQMEKTF